MPESFPLPGSKKENIPNEQEKTVTSRRNFLKWGAILSAGALVGSGMRNLLLQKEKEIKTVEKWKAYEHLKPELPFHYKEIHTPPVLENFDPLGEKTKYGMDTTEAKMLLTLTYKNITDSVEVRYPDLPKGLLLAMIMEESTGVDLLPNAKGDGGFGLIHMQGSMAHVFGLKTYKNCTGEVCDGKDHRSCKDKHGHLENHAKGLLDTIHSKKYSRGELSEIDERLQHVLNIDAAGRMMAGYLHSPLWQGEDRELDHFETAIRRYAGQKNFKAYLSDIRTNMELFTSGTALADLKEKFEKKNKDLLIDGERATFDTYIEIMQKQNENFALREYMEFDAYVFKD